MATRPPSHTTPTLLILIKQCQHQQHRAHLSPTRAFSKLESIPVFWRGGASFVVSDHYILTAYAALCSGEDGEAVFRGKSRTGQSGE